LRLTLTIARLECGQFGVEVIFGTSRGDFAIDRDDLDLAGGVNEDASDIAAGLVILPL